jgi:VWFA-related protein
MRSSSRCAIPYNIKPSTALLLAWIPFLAAAQSPEVRIHSAPYHPPSATISVDTNLVELAATVRDRKRVTVGGLQAADFKILDNDKPQIITVFAEQRADALPAAPDATARKEAPTPSPVIEQPRYLALFFDDTHSGMAGFERSKHAAEKLITTNLRPADRIGIFTGSGAVALDFTADTKVLLTTLAGMKRHPEPHAARGFGPCPTLSSYQAYVIAKHLDNRAKQIAVNEILGCQPGTPYWVAVLQAQSAAEIAWETARHEPLNVLNTITLVARHLAAEPGARILLMVSPGFLTDGMDLQIAALVEICVRNRIVINALDDEGLLSGGGDSPESLGQFQGDRTDWADHNLGQRNLIQQGFLVEATESTGGEFIHNSNDLTRGLQTLAVPPPVSYLLGFSPSDPPDGQHHKLKVSLTKAGGYEVKARPGYVSTPSEKAPETAQQRIDRVAATTDSLAEIPATVRVQAIEGRIQVDIALDAKAISFSDQNGVSAQQLTFVTILEDAQGKFLDGKHAIMDMNLTPETRAQLEAKGIKAATSFQVAKGSYRIREVIREAVQNHLHASTTPVEAH